MTADALRLQGHEVVTATDGLDGLAVLGRNGTDLIILDVEMPLLEGFSFLEQIRRHDDWKQLPVMMLTGDMRKEDVIRAKKLGAVDYLLKAQFSRDDLLNRVDRRLDSASHGSSAQGANSVTVVSKEVRSLVPATERDLMRGTPRFDAQKVDRDPGNIPIILNRDQCPLRVKQALHGRILSGIASEVIASAASPRTDLVDLAGMIARDPLLSARVLRTANSVSYVSARGAVSTISEAVRNIGCASVRNIAAAMGVFEAMPTSADEGGFNPIRCWQHSLR